jgi:mono/diheme cytochrome c family protein
MGPHGQTGVPTVKTDTVREALILPALLLGLLTGLSGAPAAQDAPSEETIGYFRQNCMSCHTIGGGRLTGPDLKGAAERADATWLADFILDPKAVIDSGDPYAAELLRKSRGVVMTKVPGIDRAKAEKLVRLIMAESAKEQSLFAGLQISDRPLTEADVAHGRELFRGAVAYENGAPACIACHTVSGIGGLGGGRLGPDLTDAFDRLEGRKAISAWLGAPPSLVMQPVFKDHPLDGEEVLALVAYLKQAAESDAAAAPASTLQFVLLGFGGALALLLLFDFLWRKRYRATRRPLVQKNRHAALGSHS